MSKSPYQLGVTGNIIYICNIQIVYNDQQF